MKPKAEFDKTESGQAEFDIVVYGASGFTGRLVAEYLAQQYQNSDVKWAMAGRSLERLSEVRDIIGPFASKIPLMQADAADPASLKAMLGRTRAVLSTVGPYQLYGSELV